MSICTRELMRCIFVPETGELVFGDDVYDSIRAGKDLSVDYKKTEFAKRCVGTLF